MVAEILFLCKENPRNSSEDQRLLLSFPERPSNTSPNASKMSPSGESAFLRSEGAGIVAWHFFLHTGQVTSSFLPYYLSEMLIRRTFGQCGHWILRYLFSTGLLFDEECQNRG
ncbi:MAG: hypothetical protein A3D65_05755 [Candidatus Lloydbacteria bacterium RIFCSPHIGHO2_02_FULL_50_13]|uniref:Uncharacterized protein n=1 Tax=Candidatus Lloydbacteria bacterium RIFCSPHIGHO2_02_FULL_50_13 TaxID=1798661 RepID=A0A1G2D2B9_9BACT|nr:MAG: hypothetical protein A3D65_05755 [Candidatus Lloydbacteria bacterium RIFCSPHIGHO2_02_FULL_50_13]